MRCITCEHPDREAIELAVIGGASIRGVAEQYGVERGAVARHCRNHVAPVAYARSTHERAGSVLARAEKLVDAADAVLREATRNRKTSLALSAMREVRESLKLIASISGELKSGSTTTVQVLNVSADPQWIRLRSAVMDVLARPEHSRARDAVVRALRDAGDVASNVRVIGPGELS